MNYSVLLFLKKILTGNKKIMVSAALFVTTYIPGAQPVFMEQHTRDSLHKLIALDKQDTNEVHALYSLTRSNTLSNTSKAVELGNKGLDLARKIKFPMGEQECQEALSFSI